MDGQELSLFVMYAFVSFMLAYALTYDPDDES